ncbi:hypothetical protein PIB30_055383 [Stylosanthes scabra]|uniref:F-box associated beta-propeller type 1 domain-containing protein n=1 Tax=Stylosanthes scabra TaxID=79078 RepID=A0ABU6TJQ5_9FABA|nr:hypothetical protein [Stylosanthes scabra]
MDPNRSMVQPGSFKSVTRSLHALLDCLREQKRLLTTGEVFGDDIIWTILVNAEPKDAARCRTLNKKWCIMFKSRQFIIKNYQANAKRQSDVIVGVGYPPGSLNSQWFCRVDGEQWKGVTEAGLNSRLMVWNPLTQHSMWIEDMAWNRRELLVSVEAFGYMKDGLEYRVVNVWRRHFGYGAFFWSVYDSKVENWTLERTYNTDIPKLGPHSIVSDGVVFWIGWDRLNFVVPKCIVSFNFRFMEFHHGEIPIKEPTENNALTKFNGGVGFITYRDIGLAHEVVVWSVYREGHDTLMWEKNASSGAANNNERCDLFVFILKHMRGTMEQLYHNHWDEDVQVKTITLHSDGLYPVRKEPPYIA